MIVPPALKPGDKIRIVSPAGKVKEEHVFPAVEWLKKQGFRVELGKYVFDTHYQFAGTDQHRYDDLQEALDDPETAAILCSRGGYGVVRILRYLNYNRLKQFPKWLIGFSDITSLHSCLNNHRFASIHGVMPRYFFNNEGTPGESLHSLMNLLSGEVAHYVIPAAEGSRMGKAVAELVGGNLSIVASMQGTRCELDTKGKILFLEDIDEFLYHTDRMMNQLKLSGKLDHLAGLVLGSFTDMKDNESPFGKTVQEIVTEIVEEYDFPVCCGFPGGHEELNMALAFGLKWKLDVGETNASLTLVQPLA